MDTLDSMVIVPTKVHYPVSSEEMRKMLELSSPKTDKSIVPLIGKW